MGQIPQDAAHWDSGDWIEWHRHAENTEAAPEAAEDTSARLTALEVSLLRAARVYFEMTGNHLPVYDTIARVHAALHFGPCLSEQPCTDTQLAILPPRGPDNIVTVDADGAFTRLLFVRIKDNFTVESRAIAKSDLPAAKNGKITLRWSALANKN